MYYNLTQTITLSLLTKTSEIDASTNKAEYQKIVTSKFNYKSDLFPEDVKKEFFTKLLDQMLQDLLGYETEIEATSLGIWVEIEDKKYENAIDLRILDDIKKYGEEGINPVLEFYKMTIDLNEIKE
jgi:hypothetical protein